MVAGKDESAIAEVLEKYEAALNQANVDGALELYANDAVFMPQNSLSSVGKEAVRQAYERISKTIRLHVKFAVAEIVQVSPEWAFARTNSSGTSTALATGATSAEGNQELFVFQNVAGDWKIARYCFSTTKPV